MPSKKRSLSTGVITIHTSTPVCLLKSAVPRGARINDCKSLSESRKTPYGRGERAASEAERRRNESWVPGPPQGPWVDWLSHTSMRQLQAKLKAENEGAMAITQTLLDTENGFVKEMERFLYLRETAELRKKELLHKRWMDRVWVPIQQKVDEHVSHCPYKYTESIRSMLMEYICYCNTKGFVFLDDYNPQEYNPFLPHINRTHNFKVKDGHHDSRSDPNYCSHFVEMPSKQRRGLQMFLYLQDCQPPILLSH
ncbi:protein FAM228A [Aplochiton taeniatus]